MRKLLFGILMSVILPSFLNSCGDNDEGESPLAYDEALSDSTSEIRKILSDDYVIYTKVTVNGVDKTLLDGGCPTHVTLSWDGDSLSFSIPEMKIGNMPFAISFKANCEVTKLNSWEEDEHAGGNGAWLKFVGNYGYVSTGDGLKPNGSSIKGYFNPSTKVVEFVIDYNVMNVRTTCERQVLDVERTLDYETELAKYVEDLTQYKKDNGLYDYNITPTPTKGDLTGGNGLPDDVDITIGSGDRFAISVEAIKGMLSGDIVLNSTVTVNGNVMAESFPTLYNFSWSGDVMTLKITDMSVGKMPFAISFSCICDLKGYASDSETGSTWCLIEGTGGVVSSNPAMISGNEGTVKCFFDPLNLRIIMNSDFNVFGASASCAEQTIDYSRADNYEAELKNYQSSSASK